MSIIKGTESSNTNEQEQFIRYPIRGKSIILSACAGSGKTKSATGRLKFLLENGVDPSRIIFFSFTVAAIEELKQRVDNDQIKITTIHSYCTSLLGKMKKMRKISTFYNFIDWFKEHHKPRYGASKSDMDKFYYDVEKLYDSAEYYSNEIAAFKLQTADNIKCKMPDFLKEYQNFQRLTKSIDFSDMLLLVRDSLKEEKWLKMFRNHYDYIFIDEYQDTSTIQMQILLSLNAKHYYLMGDKCQCVIQGTKIKTDVGEKNIEDIIVGDLVTTGVGSNNLSFKKVTDVYKNYFEGEVVRIKTESGKELVTTKEHTHFAKYLINKKELYFTYLMFKDGVGFRIGVTRSYHSKSAINNSTRFGFMTRLNGESAQKIWLLETSKTESDARYFELKYSLKYGIPTIVFNSRGQDKISTPEFIDRVFTTINTLPLGLKLLADKGYEFDCPHQFPKSMHHFSKNVNITLCQDGRSKSAIHKLEIGGSCLREKEALINAGIAVQNNGKNNGWRIRKQSAFYKDLLDVSIAVSNVIETTMNKTVLLKKGEALNFTRGNYLFEGMTMYSLDAAGNIVYDVISEVKLEYYKGYIYDINIENTHNFIANGIFTHNSIYGYSGANCDAIEAMLKKRRDTEVMNLSVNFRSKKAIVENSNKYSNLKAVPFSEEEGKVHGQIILFENLVKIIQEHPYVAVLARTNSVIRELERRMLGLKIPLRYENYLKDSELEDIEKAQERQSTKNKIRNLLPHFGSADALIQFIRSHKDKQSFITSIHKSKGREFPICVVVNSISPEMLEKNNLNVPKEYLKFISFDPADEQDYESRNVHYVAVSRPKDELYFMLFENDV